MVPRAVLYNRFARGLEEEGKEAEGRKGKGDEQKGAKSSSTGKKIQKEASSSNNGTK